jgi:hypothetical protein
MVTVAVAVPAVTVTVPVLAAPSFWATVNVTVSPETPVVGVTVSQAASLAADHDGWFVVTVAVLVLPVQPVVHAETDTDTSGLGGGSVLASCVTSTVA